MDTTQLPGLVPPAGDVDPPVRDVGKHRVPAFLPVLQEATRRGGAWWRRFDEEGLGGWVELSCCVGEGAEEGTAVVGAAQGRPWPV